MKLKLLIAFMMLSLVSCSDDDSNTTVGEKQLYKQVFKKYNDNEELVDFYYVTYDNNRMTGIYITKPTGEIYDKREFFYNANGALSQTKMYFQDLTNPYVTTDISYDTEGRILSVHEVVRQFGEVLTSTGVYNYNSDNTITYTKEHESGNVFTRTYYKNASGKIYKMEDNNGDISEAVYDGENIASYTYAGETTNFTFDTTNAPVGPFLQASINQMAGDMQNTILWGGFLNMTMGVSKYVIGQSNTSGSPDVTYEYEFDAEGYPIKIKSFNEGEALPSYISEILYQ